MKISSLQTYAETVAQHDASGHAADHIKRVVATVKQLLKQTPKADVDITIAAATLHDTYDDKLVADVAAAKAQTATQLTLAGATDDQQHAIFEIIDHMSYKANLAHHFQLSLEGQLVQDADRLDAIGAIGIARTFMYGGAHGSMMYDPAIPPRTELTAKAYRQTQSPVLNHFEEKLFKLEAQMNTPAAKRVAKARTQVMHDFVDEFLAEYDGRR
ncbi:HD domain-containing protein [Lacticaseibacillus porcinae]|uniref:HD domain-containing protein n=1 Tax=Lacticaseibacillus porcinae TaxID=1123687 RepID=UPI000F7AEC33|nr:HD domain-containing protein [Lacticaseibacillus porcinae]